MLVNDPDAQVRAVPLGHTVVPCQMNEPWSKVLPAISPHQSGDM